MYLKNLFVIIGAYLLLSLSWVFAVNFGCSRDEGKKHNIYLWDSVINLTNDSDKLKCKKWLDKVTINTLDGNDKVYTLKSDNNGTVINLWNGDDKISQKFYDGVLANIVIDGGNGYDVFKINRSYKKLVITGNCAKSCKIYVRDEGGNPDRRFKNVTLKNFEEIKTTDKVIKFGKEWSGTSNWVNNQDWNTKLSNNHSSHYSFKNLSSYKYLIPAYWWSYDLNKKLLYLPNKSSIVIINPSDWNFNSTENVFVDEIQKTHSKNNLAIGYIYTRYWKRSISDVNSRVDSRLKYYPNIDWFFLDEVSTDKKYLEHYKQIIDYIKSKNPNFVVILNPGITPYEGYLKIADNVVIYEDPCKNYSTYSLPEWTKKYPNYKITFLGYTCDKKQYEKLSDKYKNYIQYFTNDGGDWNPWDSFSKYLESDITSKKVNQTYAKSDSVKKVPFDIEKFKPTLSQCKLTYPDSHTKVVDKWQFAGYKSDFFYADKDDNLVFVLSKKSWDWKLRNELRQQQNHRDLWWDIHKNIHILNADVKLYPIPSNSSLREYTFLQIHSEHHPLLRVAVVKDKKWKNNHIWAIVRINTNDSGHRTDRYDLGQVGSSFTNIKIKTQNDKLIISRDWKVIVNKDISYWPEKYNYFKAWIYDSKDSDWPFTIKIKFKSLQMLESSNTSTKTSTNTSNNNWEYKWFTTKKTSKVTESNNSVYVPKYNSFEFSPYTDASLYPFEELSKVYRKTNQKNYTLAFIVSNNGKCSASWGGYYNIEKWPDAWINWQHKYLYDEVNFVKKKWGKITVSFGGASWIPLFESCNSVNDLFNQYKKVINQLKPYALDFDIEGIYLSKTKDFDKLFLALKKVNLYYPNVKIWFTLPVMPYGLDTNWLRFVKNLIKSWVKFSGINIMAMDYGSSYTGDMADYAIKAANNVANQLVNLYKNYGKYVSSYKAYNMLWITPMIWLNDVTSENFTLSDAKKLRDFVVTHNISKISYWDLNRDHPCAFNTVNLKCSSKNNQTKDYQYLLTLKWENIETFTSSESFLENINPERKKIASLKWKSLDMSNFNSTLRYYYSIFSNFFYEKKKIILNNPAYQTDDYFNYLKSFNLYVNMLFSDLNTWNVQWIYSYLSFFKLIIKNLVNVT